MNQKMLLLLLVLGWCTGRGNAQDVFPVVINPNNIGLAATGIGNTISPGNPNVEMRTETVKGSAYIFEGWPSGKITLKDGKVLSRDAAFNIDASIAGCGIVVLLPNGDAVDVHEILVDKLEIELKEKVHMFRTYAAVDISGKESGTWLLEVLYEDARFAFLKKYVKQVQEADNTEPYSSKARYHEYIDEVEYYLGMDGKYTKIRLKKNSIESVAPAIAAKIHGAVTEKSVIAAMNE